MGEASSTSTLSTLIPSGGVCGVLSIMPRIWRAAASADAGSSASFTPPALPRPPACTCAFTTTFPPRRSAIARAWVGVSATSPPGTGTPNWRRIALAWYSWIFLARSRSPALPCSLGSPSAAPRRLAPLGGPPYPLGSPSAAPRRLAPLGGSPYPLGSPSAAPRRLAPLGGSPCSLGSPSAAPRRLAPLGGSPYPLGSPSAAPRPSSHSDLAQEPDDGIVVFGDDALLERDDGVVRDVDMLGADLGAALRDVAETQARLDPGQLLAVMGIQRVHLQLRQPHEEARARERRLVLLVVADHVTDVLAQEALDTLAELVAALDVLLKHAPRTVGLLGPGPEGRNRLRLLVVEGDVRRQGPGEGEGLHGRHGEGLTGRERVHPRHAHEPRLAVDLGAA